MSNGAAVLRGAIPEGLLDPPLTEGLVTPGSLDDQVLAFPEQLAAPAVVRRRSPSRHPR